MRKLLYVGNKLSTHGYTRTAIETLGTLLQSEGYDVTFASSRKNKVFRLIDMIVTTISNVRKTDYVLIDTYSTSNFYYAFIVSQLCRLCRLRYIPLLHGGNLPQRLINSPTLSKMIFKHAMRNIAPSNYLLNAFHKAGYDNVTYIPNAFAISNFPFKKREDFLPKLLWVRSLAPLYNPQMALKVVELLKTDFPDVSLCMVGPDKDDMLQTLKDRAEKNQLQVSFTGRLDQQEWVSLSEQYDIFINTSTVDNAPYSLIEAAALGLPIVSTDVGGIPYIFKNQINAMLVENGNAEAMANAIRILLIRGEMAKTLQSNARSLAETYDWNTVHQDWTRTLI